MPRRKEEHLGDLADIAGGGHNGSGLPDAATIQFIAREIERHDQERKAHLRRGAILRQRIKKLGVELKDLRQEMKATPESVERRQAYASALKAAPPSQQELVAKIAAWRAEDHDKSNFEEE